MGIWPNIEKLSINLIPKKLSEEKKIGLTMKILSGQKNINYSKNVTDKIK